MCLFSSFFYSIQNKSKGSSVLINIFYVKVVVDGFQKQRTLISFWVQLGSHRVTPSGIAPFILLEAYSVYFQSHTYDITSEDITFRRQSIHIFSVKQKEINHVCQYFSMGGC